MFRLGTLLFIPGYTTITLYRVFASPQSGASLLLMIRWCFSRYVRRSIQLTRPSPTQSLDNQHVSDVKFANPDLLCCCTVLCGIAARPSPSRRFQSS
jgi:hypothetical protein